MAKTPGKFSVHPLAVAVWIWLFVVFDAFTAIGYALAIVFHEFGHFFVAKKRGYELSKFSFSPYGVCLSYYGQNLDARDEVWIALAGPTVNLVSALLVTGVWWLVPTTFAFSQGFVAASVSLALLNLLPAYPLDGGRVFVCLSSRFFSEKTARRITFGLNLLLSAFFFALFVAFCFINFNPTYFLFALFLAVGALDLGFESKYDKINVFQKKTKLFVRPQIVCVDGSTTLGQLIKKMQSSSTYIFCFVLENGRIVNLSEQLILKLSLQFPFETCLAEIFE